MFDKSRWNFVKTILNTQLCSVVKQFIQLCSSLRAVVGGVKLIKFSLSTGSGNTSAYVTTGANVFYFQQCKCYDQTPNSDNGRNFYPLRDVDIDCPRRNVGFVICKNTEQKSLGQIRSVRSAIQHLPELEIPTTQLGQSSRVVGDENRLNLRETGLLLQLSIDVYPKRISLRPMSE